MVDPAQLEQRADQLRELARLAVALAVVLGTSACTGEQSQDDAGEPQCVGQPGGVDIRQGVSNPLPGGGEAGIGDIDMDADPPSVRLVLAGTSEAERDSADDLRLGDVVTVQGVDYELTYVCASTVSLTRRGG